MNTAQLAPQKRTHQAYLSERAGATQPATHLSFSRTKGLREPPRTWARTTVAAAFTLRERVARLFSAATPGISLWRELFRQKIIGPALRLTRPEVAVCRFLSQRHRTLPLLDQPPRQIRRRGLLQPLVEQFCNLLLQIGGVGQSREFVRLKGVARRREKKLPRRLGAALGHKSLRNRLRDRCVPNIYHNVIHRDIHNGRDSLWMSVEIAAAPARCCSNCPGDYEDPDRTTWDDDDEEQPRSIPPKNGPAPSLTVFRNSQGGEA